MRSFIIFIFSVSLFLSCEPQYYEEPIPYVPVDFEISINDPKLADLDIRKYAYINSEGVRGIIIYKKSYHEYLAFERNCSFTPNEACATVDVHSSGQYMIDTCCGSVFDFSGNPIGGPAIRPMMQYHVAQNGNFLHIYNEDPL